MKAFISSEKTIHAKRGSRTKTSSAFVVQFINRYRTVSFVTEYHCVFTTLPYERHVEKFSWTITRHSIL